MSLVNFARVVLPVVLERVTAELPPEQAAKVHAELAPQADELLRELEHDADQKERRSRASLVASLAVDLVDRVVIPDDELEARDMARRAVRMASYVLDEAAALHGVELEKTPARGQA